METTKPTKFHEKVKSGRSGGGLQDLIVSWVFVSFVVSCMEELTAEARRSRRDAKEDGVSGFRRRPH